VITPPSLLCRGSEFSQAVAVAHIAASCLVAAVNRKAPAGHRKRKSIGALDEYLFHEDVGVYHKRVRGVRGFRLGAP